MDKTLETLITHLGKSMDESGFEGFKTVYIGGGTPSHLPSEYFHRFLKRLRSMIGTPTEYTVEANPESLDAEFLDVLEVGGVNRLSMGVQTYDEKLLSWLGRPAGYKVIEKAELLLTQQWHGRLSLDFLAGLPRKQGALAKELEVALSHGIGHLSLYELTIEEGTPLAGDRRALSELPGEEWIVYEWQEALGILERKGYRRYEVSNFSLPGEESIHNMGYWRLDPYLGIGPGAASTLPGIFGPVRKQEVQDLASWLDDAEHAVSEESLTPAQFALEHFMMALRTSEGLSSGKFECIFGISPFFVAPRSFEKWESSGTIEVSDDYIRPTKKGLDLVDAVLSDIASELNQGVFKEPLKWPSP